MRLMYSNLAPAAYKTATEVYANIPDHLRFKGTDEDFGNFCVLADGTETNMHRDGQDSRTGYACMVSGGEHTGGFLCLPELGLKLPYKNGTTALLRGAQLSHMVSKRQGERWFIVYVPRQDAKNVFDQPQARASQAKRKSDEAGEGKIEDELAGGKEKKGTDEAVDTDFPAVGGSDGHEAKRRRVGGIGEEKEIKESTDDVADTDLPAVGGSDEHEHDGDRRKVGGQEKAAETAAFGEDVRWELLQARRIGGTWFAPMAAGDTEEGFGQDRSVKGTWDDAVLLD